MCLKKMFMNHISYSKWNKRKRCPNFQLCCGICHQGEENQEEVG
jgi:hypothetical protein